MLFLFSQKSRQKNPPPGFPNRAPMEKETRLQGILHVSRKLHKCTSNKKALRKSAPTCSPKNEAPTEADAHFRALTYLSGPPVKDPSLKVLLMVSLPERSTVPRVLLHSHSKDTVYEAPLQIPRSPQL